MAPKGLSVLLGPVEETRAQPAALGAWEGPASALYLGEGLPAAVSPCAALTGTRTEQGARQTGGLWASAVRRGGCRGKVEGLVSRSKTSETQQRSPTGQPAAAHPPELCPPRAPQKVSPLSPD